MPDFSKVKNIPGVYLMQDMDGNSLYAGKGKRVRRRLERHFYRQDSSVTADGLLDIYEVSKIFVWYAEQQFALPFKLPDDQGRRGTLELLEVAIYKRFKPRLNRSELKCGGPLPELIRENADVTIELVTATEMESGRDPMQRIEGKLLHMLRALRKARVSGASQGVKTALVQLSKELHHLCQESLQPNNRSADLLFETEASPDTEHGSRDK
jgi:hypothetical protein